MYTSFFLSSRKMGISCQNTINPDTLAAFVFTLRGVSRAFLTSQWRNLTVGQTMILLNYVIVTSNTLCLLHGDWKQMQPPPTILESLEGACQKFQYGGNSGDSLRLFVLWKLSFLRLRWIFTVSNQNIGMWVTF